MSFVKTPGGAIMHAENHRKAVEHAKEHKLFALLLQLEPAEPVTEADLFERPESAFRGIDRQVGEPVEYRSTPLTEETIREAAEKLLTDPPNLMSGYACHPDEACPTCHVQLVQEHAHQRCPRCGYRSSCCF